MLQLKLKKNFLKKSTARIFAMAPNLVFIFCYTFAMFPKRDFVRFFSCRHFYEKYYNDPWFFLRVHTSISLVLNGKDWMLR
jgi:hypothetical protein